MKHELCRPGALRTKRVAGAAAALVVAASTLAITSPTAEAAKSITVIAHRGDRDAAPENTVAAFAQAIGKGTHVIEFDVQYSASGYPIVMHDATLNRTTSCSGKVKAKSRTQVKRCDAGEWFSSRFDDERVPTLRGALSAISRQSGSVKVLLHLKQTPSSTQANRTMDDVKAYGMTDRTYILASNAATFKKLKTEGARHFAYIFNTSAGWDKDYEVMVPYDTRLSSSGIRDAHRRGNQVWAVENHPASLRSMLEDGEVDGILADHLDSLMSLLSPSISARAVDDTDRYATAEDEQHNEDTWEDEVTRPR